MNCMSEILDELRRAIRESGESINSIAKATGVAHPVIVRFMQGRDIRLTTVDKLLDHFGLKLIRTKPDRRTAKRKRKK